MPILLPRIIKYHYFRNFVGLNLILDIWPPLGGGDRLAHEIFGTFGAERTAGGSEA